MKVIIKSAACVLLRRILTTISVRFPLITRTRQTRGRIPQQLRRLVLVLAGN
jgi:hypothetical protein